MEAKQSQIGWPFGVQWLLLSTVGWALGFFVGFALGTIISEDLIPNSVFGEILAYFMLGTVLGSVVGLMQWFVLRRQISRAGWWILASAAGLAVVIGAGITLAALMEYSVELGSFASLLRWVLVMALGGAVTGILQRPVLQQRVSRASWWVLANTLGWALCIFVAGSAGLMLPGLQIVAFFGGGILLGGITGVAMVWLLRQPMPEA
jgi:hypothetical protein